MKILANFARILVGIEFIFSGFVKIVDPYGTGLKFQEYFEVFAGDLPILKPVFHLLAENSQAISLLFCAVELILGVALLFNYKVKIAAWISLILMGIFTFLTFYSAYFNKVTDCGCFGDFLKLEPWHSFIKDIISLGVILIIFVYRNNFKDFKFGKIATALSAIVAFGIGLYAFRYLPPLDFLPYAKGKSISEQMAPTGVKPIMEYVFLDKNSNAEISSQEFLMDTLKYKYQSVKVLNENEVQPKITDFSVSDKDGNSITDEILTGNKLLIIIKKTKGINEELLGKIKSLAETSQSKINPVILTSVSFKDFAQINTLDLPVYSADEKVLKTMARANPTIILLKNGTVLNKWSVHNIPSKLNQ